MMVWAFDLCAVGGGTAGCVVALDEWKKMNFSTALGSSGKPTATASSIVVPHLLPCQKFAYQYSSVKQTRTIGHITWGEPRYILLTWHVGTTTITFNFLEYIRSGWQCCWVARAPINAMFSTGATLTITTSGRILRKTFLEVWKCAEILRRVEKYEENSQYCKHSNLYCVN